MIRDKLLQAGEVITRAGDAFIEQADEYRALHGNPREVHERNIFDSAGERLQQTGSWLIHLTAKDSK